MEPRINLVALVCEIAVVNAFTRVCVMTELPGGHDQPHTATEPAEAVTAP